MGQGQADIAMQLLHDCARNGEWLCLKNLHLVTPWLAVLEKVRRDAEGCSCSLPFNGCHDRVVESIKFKF